MPRFVFIDTEATGLDHARHELTEVAWILRTDDGTEVTRQYFPEHTLDGAEPAALELTNYDTAIAPRPRTPARIWLRRFLEDATGAYLVGAVPDFDATHLARMCRKMGWEPTWDHHLIDVETLALPLIAGEPEGPRSLARTARALGVVHDDRLAHGALYDAQQAMAVFDAVWDRLAKLRADNAPLPPPVATGARRTSLPNVVVVPVTAQNALAVAGISPRPQQQLFMPRSVAELLVTAFHSDWEPLAMVNEGTVVGHVMWRREDGVVWLDGFVIDAAHQGRGAAAAGVQAMLAQFGEEELRSTIHPDNHPAHRFATQVGFEPTDASRDGEIVWVRPAAGETVPNPGSPHRRVDGTHD